MNSIETISSHLIADAKSVAAEKMARPEYDQLVHGESVSVLQSSHPSDEIRDKIVMIASADPGFDFDLSKLGSHPMSHEGEVQ